MSLSTALNNAKSGLVATQRQVAGSSENIANARTPGYVAKEARITSQNVNGLGSGVSADMLRSPVDSILLRDVRLEAATLGTLDVRAQAAGRVATVSGDPSDERSLAFAFTRLETTFQDLYDAPERADLQREVFAAASNIVQRFKATEDAIQGARLEAERTINEGVRVVNDALAGIADLNKLVAEGIEGGTDISGVLDERDRLIDLVAEQIGIRTFTRERGEVVITTTEGVTLLDRDPRTITFTPVPTIDATTPLTSLSGLEVDGFDIAPSPPAGPQDLRSGIIAGAFIARDTDLPAYQAQIDALAKQTILMFQETDASVVADNLAFPGAPFTGSLFVDGAGEGIDPTAVPPFPNIEGLAGLIQINPLVDPSAGGDTSLLRDGMLGGGNPAGFKGQIEDWLTALSTPRAFNPAAGLTDQTTLQGFASELSTGHQSDRANLEGLADRSRTIFQTLENRRFNENGVNVDEESERLLELEQAYAANAQVINVIARMFDELLARIA